MMEEIQIGLTLLLFVAWIDVRVKLTKLRVCFDTHIENKKKG